MRITNPIQQILLFVLTVCCIAIAALSSNAQNKAPKFYAVIDIIIDDPSLIKSDGAIEILMNKDGLNSSAFIDLDLVKQRITNEKTRIILPLSASVNYGQMIYSSEEIQPNISPLNYTSGIFIFQNRDTVEIHLTAHAGGATFLGNNREKFASMYAINQLMPDPFKKEDGNIVLRGEYKAAMEILRQRADDYFKKKLTVLNQVKNKVDPLIYQLLYTDSQASSDMLMLDHYMYNSRGRNQEDIDLAASEFAKGEKYQGIDSLILVQSYSYCDYLLEKERLLAGMKFSPYLSGLRFSDVVDNIYKRYKGAVRDKLILLEHLKDGARYKEDEDLSLTARTLNQKEQNIFTRTLRDLRDKIGTERNAFAFAMPDKDGRIWKLNDFKGKVLVIDFWYSGCLACIFLANEMKPVIESYKSNPNVAFVTMNIDKSKEQWLQSLKGGKYTTDDEINLWANGARQAEIIKYYGVVAYPRLIVISKKGKIITASPPVPFKEAPENSKEFKRLIDKNL